MVAYAADTVGTNAAVGDMHLGSRANEIPAMITLETSIKITHQSERERLKCDATPNDRDVSHDVHDG